MRGDEDSNQKEYKAESPLAEGWRLIISQKIPCGGQHISQLIRSQILSSTSIEPYAQILDRMEAAEREFFGNLENPLFSWNELTVCDKFRSAGFKVKSVVHVISEKRRISQAEIRRWFDTETSAYGRAMISAAGQTDLQKLVMLLENASQNQIFTWQSLAGFFCISAD